jgi:RluA family pseudouridine synthase
VPLLRHRSVVTSRHAGERLDAYLAEWLPARLGAELTRSAIRRLIMAGAVTVDGRPLRRPGLVLRDGSPVEARIDLARLTTSNAPPRVEILYRDACLLAVAKPAGLLVHASADSRRPDLYSLLRAMLAEESAGDGPASSAPYLGLHHRLDVDTSGVMLFSVDAAANAGLARAFAAREVEKIYRALVARPAGRVPGAWTERAPLAMSGSGRHARMSAAPGGLEAETAFAVVETFGPAALVEARPRTGRKHQIRAHLAARGLPVLGDARYGGPAAIGGDDIPRVMLHACSLRLRHPVTGAALDIRCPYPQDFRDLLTRLSRSPDRVGHLQPESRSRRRTRVGPALDTPGASR